jgi:(E)-4-hydroxy-3-methylbut-2-enyl-diphosphate synthase
MTASYLDKYCIDLHNYERFPTREIKVGDISLGALNPIRIQSMTNLPATDIKGTVTQCKEIFDAGADFVRISTPRLMDVEALKEIKHILHSDNYTKPLIADVHFNPKIAEEAAKIVEKVRINPGNYVDKRANFKIGELSDYEYNLELEKIHQRILPLIKICKEYGTAIRIGSNHGSLSDRILARYGNTVEGMVEAAMEFIDIFMHENFYNLVISMKASDTKVMTQACRLLNARMLENKYVFPQHLGVTEAGSDKDGRLKSAVGIGAILNDGIGDTIRVSLTEKPENEIFFAKKIIDLLPKQSHRLHNIAQINNTYNPYKTSKKYSSIPLLKEQFAIISNDEDSNSDLIYFKNLIEINPQKKYITDYNNWKTFSHYENVYPYIKLSDFNKVKTNQASYHFFELSTFELNKINPYTFFNLNRNIYPVLVFNTENPLGELRYFFNKVGSNIDIPLMIKYNCQSFDYEELLAEIGTFPGSGLIDNLASGLWLNIANKSINSTDLTLDLLQSIGIRYSKAEFISCPGCGRTNYNLEKLTQEIKSNFSHLKGLKIAVMGCIVNGPGEMTDADYGCIGSGKNLVNIYKGRNVLVKNIHQNDVVEELKKILIENNDWNDK